MRSNDQKCFSGLRSFYQCCVAFDHSIFLDLSSIFLLIIVVVLKPSSVLYLPSMTSICCLLNIFQHCNLNQAFDKDNYLVPPMEQILQKASGSERLSLIDGFSGYNQLLMPPPDHLKTSFHTPWGTYAYRKMPFGLINVGATFYREMEIVFHGLINQSVVVYLDDITIFSKNKKDYLSHLRVVLERFRKYGISLNPKKLVFVLEQGKLLGFIVSKDRMIIDPERTQVIAKLSPPSSKKSMQSFLGKINFVRKFVPSFSEMVRPLQNLIKKDV
jgi:hypothetical protein